MTLLAKGALAPLLSEPLASAASHLASDQVDKAIEDVAPETLRASIQRAAARVASDVSVKPEAVLRLLPMAEIDATLAKLSASQPRAIASWRALAGGLGGLLGRASQTPGEAVAAPSPSDRLRALASTMQRDKAVAEPLAALAADLAAWEALIDRVATTIASSPELRSALRIKKGKRVALVASIAAALVVIGIIARAAYVARAHVTAAIAKDDPCVAFDVAEIDLGRVSADLRAKVSEKRKACEDRRAEEARVAEEARLRKEREEAERRAREKRESDCAALADHVDAEKLSPDDEAFAADAGLTKRIAASSLETRDFGPEDPKMPCAGSKAEERLWAAYRKAVLAKSWAMLRVSAPGPAARAAFGPDGGKMPFRLRKGFATRANDAAKFAVRTGKVDDAKRASAWCEVARALGMPMAGACDAADRLAKGK